MRWLNFLFTSFRIFLNYLIREDCIFIYIMLNLRILVGACRVSVTGQIVHKSNRPQVKSSTLPFSNWSNRPHNFLCKMYQIVHFLDMSVTNLRRINVYYIPMNVPPKILAVSLKRIQYVETKILYYFSGIFCFRIMLVARVTYNRVLKISVEHVRT